MKKKYEILYYWKIIWQFVLVKRVEFQVHIYIDIFGTWNANEQPFFSNARNYPSKIEPNTNKLWDRLYD